MDYYYNDYSKQYPDNWPQSPYDVSIFGNNTNFNKNIKVGDYVWRFRRGHDFNIVTDIPTPDLFTIQPLGYYGIHSDDGPRNVYKYEVMKAEHGVPLHLRVPQADFHEAFDRRNDQKG